MHSKTLAPLLLLLSLSFLTACSMVQSLDSQGKPTYENYIKVKKGMDEESVVKLLGAPSNSLSAGIASFGGTNLDWDGGSYTINIQFFKDKMVGKQFLKK